MVVDLTARQQRRFDQLAEKLPQGMSREWYAGALYGYRQALLIVYTNADEMFHQDPTAADLTLTLMAIEKAAKGD